MNDYEAKEPIKDPFWYKNEEEVGRILEILILHHSYDKIKELIDIHYDVILNSV